MGWRKFRLTARKNYERNRYRLPLLVRVPISLAEKVLFTSQVKQLRDLRGWSIMQSTSTEIKLCKIQRQNVSMTLDICGYTCSLHVGSRVVPSFVKSVSHLPALLTLLEEVNDYNVCPGITDAKYTPLIEKHHGKFHDPYGKIA